MRKINKIVLHHSVTNDDVNYNVMNVMKIFNREHKVKFYDKYVREGLGNEQPISTDEFGEESHIAYHYLIDKEGDVVETRRHEHMGYHAGNIQVNRESIAICFLGNFERDGEHPTRAQYETGRELISQLKAQYPTITEVKGHNFYKATACPGKNLNVDKFKEIEIENGNKFTKYLQIEIDKGYTTLFKKHDGEEILTEGEIRTLMEIGFARFFEKIK